MHSVIVSLIRGFVRVRLRGGDQEQLLNRMVGDRMIVWNISRLEDELELDMHLGDFFRLLFVFKRDRLPSSGDWPLRVTVCAGETGAPEISSRRACFVCPRVVHAVVCHLVCTGRRH